MSTDLKSIAMAINERSKKYQIGNLQNIRKELKKLKRKAGNEIFVESSNSMADDWAYHYGGRSEIQFNIGLEDKGSKFRYGLAFSLEASRTLPDTSILIPKIEKLNKLIQEKPEIFVDYKMWYWRNGQRSNISNVSQIGSDLMQSDTFIFIGKMTKTDNLDYDDILRTFDKMLDIYKYIETEEKVLLAQSTKICVLKPIMWNTKNYKGPSGFQSSSGFSKINGYGHEEWNNDNNWIWNNFKVFNTKSKSQLIEYSKEGNLCMVMIASFKRNQYAVGIATNVYHNDSEERVLIANELNTYENHEQVWQQGTVKKAFDNNKEKFIEQWEQNYTWIQWKCPIENYYWFENPILLNPKDFTDKGKLISMHGSYQRVRPQDILKVFYDQIKEKTKIIEWLTTDEFDTELPQNNASIESNSKLREKYLASGANAPASKPFSYWVEGQRSVEPLHAKLQSRFVLYLSEKGIKYQENKDYIDVQYYNGKETYYCEIKPTENLDSKYAIRIAVGQLLEYQYFNNKEAKLEIVLSKKPRKEEIEFILSLNMKITYWDDLTKNFMSY